MELPYIDSGPTAAITARFLHNTIADNRGGTGGLYLDGYTTAFMTNTILAGHTYSALRVEASSTATLEATLWHGNGSLTYGDGTIISSTNVYSAPGFVDASTWDYHLAADSAAIDAGVDAGVPDDIDGDQRPVDGDLDGTAAMDIGADEVLVPVITLTKSAPAWFNLGTYITYTLRVTNTGLVTGYNVILTDTLPAGSNFTWASDNGVEASDVVTWPAFSVPPDGGVVTRTFAVTAADTITNTDYRATAQGVSGV
ncbi:MAG: choice-of-anchor Q domain-containing protein, partial [Chloroflexota bacterium]|nr:choice-of-anchor Q domain-containing protein [Chloroflexota bacterium]